MSRNETMLSETRLYDLVRYARHLLHEEKLITDEEFANLVSTGSASARRLEDYAALRKRVEELEEATRGLLLYDGPALIEQALKAEQERDYEQERNRLNVQQWSEENAKLQADLDAALDVCESDAADYEYKVILFKLDRGLCERWRLSRERVRALMEKRREIEAEALAALRAYCQRNGLLYSWAASRAIRDWLANREATSAE